MYWVVVTLFPGPYKKAKECEATKVHGKVKIGGAAKYPRRGRP